MEAITKSLYLTKFPNSQTYYSSSSNSPISLHSKATSVTFNSSTHHLHKCFLFQQPGRGVIHPIAKNKGKLGAIHASEAATPITNATGRWILEPIG